MGVVRNAIYKAIIKKDVDVKMDTIMELIEYTKQVGGRIREAQRTSLKKTNQPLLFLHGQTFFLVAGWNDISGGCPKALDAVFRHVSHRQGSIPT